MDLRLMKSKTVEILIVVFVLFLLGALFGCKDKAEARVESFDTSEPIQWGESYFLEVVLTEEPTFEDGETRIYLYKGDDFDIVIEKKEPNEPIIEIDPNSELVTSLNLLYDPNFYEPNEPLFELVPYSTTPTSEGTLWLESDEIPPPSIFYYDGEKKIEYIPIIESNELRTGILEIGTGIWTCTVCGKINHNYKEIIEHFCKSNESEPNEPECKHERIFGVSLGYNEDNVCCAVCGESIKTYDIDDADTVLHYHEPVATINILTGGVRWSINGVIPTWPDYIELEKDLWIDCIDGLHDSNDYYIITKGTKIYFKENE